MKKEQDFIIIPERYIFESTESFIIEKNKEGIFINGELKKYIEGLSIYTEDDKNVIKVNKLFTESDFQKIRENIK